MKEVYRTISTKYARETGWHRDRIVNAGARSWECPSAMEDFGGASDARHPDGKIVSTGIIVGFGGAAGAGLIRRRRRRDLADQGSRQHRGRAAEPVDRLRPRGRS